MENIMKILTSIEDPDVLGKDERTKGWNFLYVTKYIRCKFNGKYFSSKRSCSKRYKEKMV